MLVALLGISVLLIVHELGHFWAAKGLGYEVTSFGVGFGPVVFRKKVRGTEFRIAVLPFGAYVEVPAMEKENVIPAWDKIRIAFSGPLCNFVLAYVLIVIVLAINGVLSGRLDSVSAFLTIFPRGLAELWRMILLLWQAIVLLVTRPSGVQVMGIIGITAQMANFARTSLVTFLYVLAFISANLGFVNLIPFPALDGSLIVTGVVEAALKKPVPAKWLNVINTAGFIILMGLMIYLSLLDVRRLLG